MRILWLLRQLRQYPIWATCIGIAVIYFVGYFVYYRVVHGWTHPAEWWLRLEEEEQAAWIAAIGTLGAVWWGLFLYAQERVERQAIQRKLAQPIALRLIDELGKLIKAMDFNYNHPEFNDVLVLKARNPKPYDLTKLVAILENPITTERLSMQECENLHSLHRKIINFNERLARAELGSLSIPDAQDIIFIARHVFDDARESMHALKSRYGLPMYLDSSDATYH